MKVIFTYCNMENRATKPSEFVLNCARLSSGSVKKFTNYKTVLYVDPKQHRWFKNIPYYDEIVKVDYFADDFDVRYWNYPKLKTYSLQEEPFLHMDLDMCVMPGFTIPEGSDVITEKLRSIVNDNTCYRHLMHGCPIPDNIICSGMIGCNNVDIINIFKIIHARALTQCRSGVHENVSFGDLYSIEEVLFTQLSDFYKYSVSEIMVSKFMHFQGKNKEYVFFDEVKRLLKNFKL